MKRLILIAAFLLAPSLALAQGVAVQVQNAGSGGTVLNSLAKLTGAPSTAVKTATTDISGAEGIVVSGAGTTGNALILKAGQPSCNFDAATTAGDWVQISGTIAGDCHDAGSVFPVTGQVIGRVLSTNAAAGLFPVNVGGGAQGNAVANGGTGASTGSGAAVNLSHSYNVCTPTFTPLTGTTTETVIADCAIPANLLGTNNEMRVYFLSSISADTNSKTFGLRYAATSGIGGTICGLATATSSGTATNFQVIGSLWAAGATNAQVCSNSTAGALTPGATSGVTTVDTTATSHLVITGTLGNSADTITPLVFKVELLPVGGN